MPIYILFALMAGFLFTSGGWLAFWCFMVWMDDHPASTYWIIPFVFGLSDEPFLASCAVLIIYLTHQDEKTKTTSTIPKVS